MKRLLRGFFLLSLLLNLPACAVYKLEELRHVTPGGTPFQKALTEQYRALSMLEEKRYSWWNAVYFADKALRAAYCEDVAPEDLAAWNIAAAALPDLETARGQVLAMLTEDNMTVRPQLAAEMQASFDAWVAEQDKGWNRDNIDYARYTFDRAYEELIPEEPEPAPEPVKPKPKPKPKAKPALKPKPKAKPEKPAKQVFSPPPAEPEPVKEAAEEKPKEAELASYIVFFAANLAELNASAARAVDKAAESVKSVTSYRVVIRADRPASDDLLDPLLLQARVQAIKARLVESGIAESSIEVASAKASTPATAAQRVVEILISE